MKPGSYLFRNNGGKGGFFAASPPWVRRPAGRPSGPVLRAFAALVAGITQMDWRRFLAFTLAGGVVWAPLLGVAGYNLGKQAHRLLGAAGVVVLVIATILLVIAFIAIRRNEQRLEDEAERVFPGPLAHQLGKHRGEP